MARNDDGSFNRLPEGKLPFPGDADFCGTDQWLAPEQVDATWKESRRYGRVTSERRKNTPATDIWGLGACISHTATLQCPSPILEGRRSYDERRIWDMCTGDEDKLSFYPEWEVDVFPPGRGSRHLECVGNDVKPDNWIQEAKEAWRTDHIRPRSSRLNDILKKALAWDPQERCTAEQLDQVLQENIECLWEQQPQSACYCGQGQATLREMWHWWEFEQERRMPSMG